MRKEKYNIYETPEVQVMAVEFENVFCVSGNIEGTTEEDWNCHIYGD